MVITEVLREKKIKQGKRKRFGSVLKEGFMRRQTFSKT